MRIAPGDDGFPSRNILIADLIIDTYNQAPAIGVDGDRITIDNPTIINPYVVPDGAGENAEAAAKVEKDDGGGIRVTAGTGFRCRNGFVAASGDAALQFSGGPEGRETAHGAFLGTRCSSTAGRPLLVGSAYGPIRHVRYVGVTGETTAGTLAQIQLQVPRSNVPSPFVPSPITGITFRDTALSRTDGAGAASNDGVVVRNFAATEAADADTISHLRFANLVVVNDNSEDDEIDEGGSGLWVVARKADEDQWLPGVPKPVESLVWSPGRVAALGRNRAVLELADLIGGAFSAISISADTDRPVVSCGKGGRCRTIAFSDLLVAGLRDGRIGVSFDLATCGAWSRGALAGASTSIPLAVTADTIACSFAAADVSAAGPIATPFTAATADCRIAFNHGCAQRTAVTLGAARETALDAVGAAAAASSWMKITDPGAGGVLRTITGGAAGDLLVLTTEDTAAVTVAKATTTGNIRIPADVALAAGDTLLLGRRPGGDYAGLAGSDHS